jgi:hypothetical protein
MSIMMIALSASKMKSARVFIYIPSMDGDGDRRLLQKSREILAS